MSSLFGSTRQSPQNTPKTLGVDESRYATHQQARPLPYVAGQVLCAVTWLDDVYGVRSRAIRRKVGKKATTVGYDYFCSFAGVVCHGVVETLHEIRFDAEVVWQGPLVRSGDAQEITIETRGTATVYWGTETQDADPDLVSGSGHAHPPYRGQCYLVFNDCSLGQNRTQVPNVEVVVSRYPAPAWMPAGANVEDDANVVACCAEWLQNSRYGLQLPDARLDTGALAALAVALADEELGVSPYVNRTQTARQLLVEALEYCDGYVELTAGGLIAIRLVRPESAPTTSFDETTIRPEPSLDAGGWSETMNETVVEYTNRARGFQEDGSNWRDAGNYQITGEPQTQRLARPWCTRQAMADQIAASAGRIAGIPKQSGSLTVLDSALDGLTAGGRFLLSWAEWGFTDVVCRCVRLQYGAPGEPLDVIDWEVDLSDLNDDAYLPPAVDIPATPVFDPEPNAEEILFEVPSGWDGDVNERLLLFAVRGNGVMTGFNAHHRLPSLEYNFETPHDRFIVHGTLDEEYPAGTPLIDDVVGLLVTLDGVDLEFENRTFEDALTNDVLLFVGGEIIAIFGAVLQSGDTWRIHGLRNRYDTDRLTHAAASDVWIVERSQAQLTPSHPEDTVQTWKLQPFTINREVDLGDVTAVTLATDHRGLRPYRPLSLADDGNQFDPTFATGENLDLTWEIALENRPLPLWSYWLGGLTQGLPGTVLEFLDGALDLKRTVVLDPGVAGYTYANAELVADFGGEETVVVRAYHARGAFRSTLFEQLTVTFV